MSTGGVLEQSSCADSPDEVGAVCRGRVDFACGDNRRLRRFERFFVDRDDTRSTYIGIRKDCRPRF
jgi:hypothetical protein